jgi:hypothetical protein
VTLIIILCSSVPTSYFVGRKNGLDTGYQVGSQDAYSEGFDEGVKSGRFDFYYVKPEQKYDVNKLSDYLARWRWIRPYEEGVFDCSEMSAYLEMKLENEGWHSVLVTGDSPFSSGKHAWILVETEAGKYMPVESTNMGVVWWADPHFDAYFTYEHRFETIQEALNYNEADFDWWEN